MSPLKRSATGDDSIAVLIAAAITVMVMATATINHTAYYRPYPYYGYGYYRPYPYYGYGYGWRA